MSTSNEVATLRLALEALENISTALREDDVLGSDIELMLKTITAIKEALSSPNGEAQPEAACCNGNCPNTKDCKQAMQCLYTTPYVATPRPQRTAAEGEDTRRAWVEPREWRGLTPDEIRGISFASGESLFSAIMFTHDKLKAKNERLEKNTRNGGCL